MTIHLVTGANGFIGSQLCTHLLKQGLTVCGTVRDASRSVPTGVQPKITGAISGATDWSDALAGVTVVYHLASTVHRLEIADALLYQTTITEATAALARQAATAGVKRLILLSTASVYGLETASGLLVEDRKKQPITLYGRAKLQAETELQAIARQTGLEIVIVRPPMVYGKSAPGNFGPLIRLVEKIPVLPFGAALEKRSFIGIDNLLDFLLLCAVSAAATNKVFNISDDNDISLKELCVMIAAKFNKKCLLLPVPPAVMRVGLKTIGKESMYNKLFGSFRLDVAQAKTTLGWKPVYAMQEQLVKALQ